VALRGLAVTGVLTLGVSMASASDVVGIVRVDGPVPEPTVLTLEPGTGDHSTEGCGNLTKTSPRLLVAPEGGITNGVVWLEGVPATSGGEAEATDVLDQFECVFRPHVVMVPVGGELAVRNSDRIRHNIRIFDGFRMLTHQWQPAGASDFTWRFEQPGRYLVRCGAHPWMYAWVIAVEHGFYAVTDATGTFRLSDVVPGYYRLHVWHETLGEQEQPIQVGVGRSFVTVRLSHNKREE
jgi:plastocyanin